MARGRRRSTRTTSAATKREESSPLSDTHDSPADAMVIDESASSAQDAKPATKGLNSKNGLSDQSCPGCTQETSRKFNTFEKENWIMCDICKTWYHSRCAKLDGEYELDRIDKWYCTECITATPGLSITLKPPARKSDRKHHHLNYASLDAGLPSADVGRWSRMLEGKDIPLAKFQHMEGKDVGIEWLEDDESDEDNEDGAEERKIAKSKAMTEPIIIDSPEGLGMKMPEEGDFGVEEVAELVGEDVPVEVIDVASQSTSPGWTLGKWADYFALSPSSREKIYNVISLEVTGTPLADKVLPPRLVRELDWVENFWPNTRKGKGHVWPKVQLYCLMGVEGAWTDWHVDFAGSSVYYHVLFGSKVFYFIRPTPANLATYQRWSGTDLQSSTWLGDMVDEVVKVELTQGNTMIIPTGWIHAVFTPVDTLVFGGNFLHSYNVPTQLRVRNIEIATQVPKKFRYPLFSKLCWYVGDKYLRVMASPSSSSSSSLSFSPRVLEGLLALADFLVSEARLVERNGGEKSGKEAKEMVPSERVKDASAAARELRWRVRMRMGMGSGDEGSGLTKINGSTGIKRKRVDSATPEQPEDGRSEREVKFRNFKPRRWEGVVERTEEQEKKVVNAHRPEGVDEGWQERWMKWGGSLEEESEDADKAEVNCRRQVIVKMRKTATGLERQRIERVVEEWAW